MRPTYRKTWIVKIYGYWFDDNRIPTPDDLIDFTKFYSNTTKFRKGLNARNFIRTISHQLPKNTPIVLLFTYRNKRGRVTKEWELLT